MSGALGGLLCLRCNAGIANVRDDPDRLARAAAYVAAGRKLGPPA